MEEEWAWSPHTYTYLDGTGQGGAVSRSPQEKKGAHPHPGRLGRAAAGLPVRELGMLALSRLSGHLRRSNEAEEMQKRSNRPTVPGKCEASS